MSDAGQDLRDAACLAGWAATLPSDLRTVLHQVSTSYFECDNLIDIVLPHALQPPLRQAG